MFHAQNAQTCGKCHAYPSATSFALMVPICTKRHDLAIPELEKASQRERLRPLAIRDEPQVRFVTCNARCMDAILHAGHGWASAHRVGWLELEGEDFALYCLELNLHSCCKRVKKQTSPFSRQLLLVCLCCTCTVPLCREHFLLP